MLITNDQKMKLRNNPIYHCLRKNKIPRNKPFAYRRLKAYPQKTVRLIKETKHNTNRQKDMLYSWIGEINIIKMTILPQTIYRFNTATSKLLQLCPTLCDPIDGSPPGSPVPGVLQARTLEWVAISFSNA